MNRIEVSRSYRDAHGIVLGGAIAGIVSGIAMALVAMGYAATMGMGFLAPLRLIAAALYGVDALVGGAGILMTGLLIHTMVSAILGIIFAALLPARASGRAAFGLGLLYGVAVWLIMSWAIGWANPVMDVRVPLMLGAWFMEHIVFGAVLGITPALLRNFSIRRLAEVTPYPEPKAA